eukprot:COSAG01_NODE_1918_length_8905_cov_2.532591_12_plen_96_part_01
MQMPRLCTIITDWDFSVTLSSFCEPSVSSAHLFGTGTTLSVMVVLHLHSGVPGCNASWLDPSARYAHQLDCRLERRFASGTTAKFDTTTNTGAIAW